MNTGAGKDADERAAAQPTAVEGRLHGNEAVLRETLLQSRVISTSQTLAVEQHALAKCSACRAAWLQLMLT